MAKRRARVDDLHEIAMNLPGVTLETSWGDRPTYKVKGKGFLIFREPRADAIDPGTGDRMDDVVVFMVPDQTDKDALVAEDGPFFTTAHFNGHNAVLLRQRDLGRISRDELAEVIADAWLACAPKRLAASWLAERGATG